jgi:hypothetical protein
MDRESRNDSMTAFDDPSIEISDRRRNLRVPSRGLVRVVIETRELSGRADNVSQNGVLFFSDSDLRVTVQVGEGTEARSIPGRLVRAQRMRGDHFGWAVEFDPS